jgi:hypothetical protein
VVAAAAVIASIIPTPIITIINARHKIRPARAFLDCFNRNRDNGQLVEYKG